MVAPLPCPAPEPGSGLSASAARRPAPVPGRQIFNIRYKAKYIATFKTDLRRQRKTICWKIFITIGTDKISNNPMRLDNQQNTIQFSETTRFRFYFIINNKTNNKI
jgi:hypothetical protein